MSQRTSHRPAHAPSSQPFFLLVLLLLLVLVCLLLLLIFHPGFAGSVRQDAATSVPQAIGVSITSAASLGPLVVRRELKPRRLLGRSRKWQSPLWDTPWNSHTSPKCATTSTSLRPAWRKVQTRLEAHRQTRRRTKNVRSCAEFSHAPRPFEIGRSYSQVVDLSKHMSSACDWTHARSLMANLLVVRTTLETGFRSCFAGPRPAQS